MRIATLILSIGMVMMLLGCGLFDDDQEAAESTGKLGSPVSAASEDRTAPSAVSETPDTSATSVASETAPSVTAPMSIGYDGPSSLEERVFDSPVIARVRLDSATSSVVSETILDGSTKYIPILEFSFSVLEYLKGRGSSNIVAYWAAAPLFDTRHEAEAALPAIVAARDTQWDDHEAIVFLQHPDTAFPSAKQPDRYYLSWGGSWSIPDDGYSIASIHNKLWLPAEGAVSTTSQPSGNQQRFLLDVPPATGEALTITLGEMKDRIAAVTAKLAAGDGSEVYRDCLQRTYQYEGINRYRIEKGDEGFFYRIPDQKLNSGLAVSSVVYEGLDLGGLPDWRDELWFDGRDSELFSVAFGDSTPFDFSGDGTSDSIQYTQRVLTARPIPAGVYRFHLNHRDAFFVSCQGYTFRYEWQVVVNAPEGTLHEAFFDPVTVGSAVAADGANGVLKPALFAGANGATTTIERIAWEPGSGATGTVKVALSPHTGVASHAVDFIALDGSVSLSLNVADAAVDLASNTLSWPVVSQPWQNGDELMVRIREAPDCSTGAVPDTSANPGLARDCEVLLVVMDTLRGTGTLNWVVYAAEWSEHAEAVPGTTTKCMTPTFGASYYTFPVREDAAVGDSVGTVSATDLNDDAVTYTITAGIGEGKFAIATSTGVITVAGELDYETTPSYTLTVEVSDVSGNTAISTVDIAVTDVFDQTPPVP